MNNINTQLDLLINVTLKKSLYLKDILAYTKEQTDLLEQEEFDLNAFNRFMEKKEVLINQVVEIDDGFQSIYRKVRSVIEAHPELYKEKIQALKQSIITIGDLSVTITVQEERNKMSFMSKSREEKSKVKEFRQSKKTVANYYSNMNKQNNSNTPHFFDSKK
ncbi:MAG: hypothetical protein CVV02_00845 [Firmicutes bacterium HGW-Firmicutes-7]|nr:MAG: hypothetical protein CVV02_00845 [Firmicutes bacterium HGW-Firmicutes-7]